MLGKLHNGPRPVKRYKEKMAKVNRARLLGTFGQWAAVALCTVLGICLFAFVDLEPKVQADFFFSSDDPQLQSSIKIEKEFGQSQQIFVAAVEGRLDLLHDGV